MAAEFIRLKGVDDLKLALRDLDRSMRRKVLKAALRSAARVIQSDAKSRAPVLQMPTPRRVPGTVKRSIVVRASKLARRKNMVGVYVTVKASKARVKKDGRQDPFYFRFLEEGWIPRGPGRALRGSDRKKRAVRAQDAGRKVQRPFLGPALQAKSQAAVQAFEREVLPAIAKFNRRK